MKIRAFDWHSEAEQGFIELPWKLYANGSWIPPLKASIAAELGPGNLFFRHGKAQCFLAEEEGEVLGRIVASVDEQLENQEIGHFGYFECSEDPRVAAGLLAAAEDWLRAQGKRVVHGPVNLNIYTGYRLQISGFETRPFLGEPRALPYYAGQLAGAGYVACASWNSWDIPAAVIGQLQGYMRHKAAGLPPEYHIRTLAQSDEQALLADLHTVALAIFAENYGYAQIDLPEFLQVYQGLLGLFRRHPQLLGLFYDGDRPVGFGFVYPDYGPFFQQADGDLTQMQKFMDFTARGMIFHTFGFLKDYRQTAMPYALFVQGFQEVLDHGHTYAIGALAKEGRTAYDQLGAPTRSYAIFEKRLS